MWADDAGKLWVRPPEGAALTDEDRALIVEMKADILDALWNEDGAAAGRALGWPQESVAWNGTGFDPIPGGRRQEGPTDDAGGS